MSENYFLEKKLGNNTQYFIQFLLGKRLLNKALDGRI